MRSRCSLGCHAAIEITEKITTEDTEDTEAHKGCHADSRIAVAAGTAATR
jgi:hypothetical protein